MGKKILDSKALYIVLSLVIALALWIYVTSMDGQENTKSINIPVSFTDTEFLDEQGLRVLGDYSASITVRATPMVLARLDDKTVQITASVSSITSEGEYTVPYTVTPPAGVNRNDMEIISGVNGSVVRITVARFIRREIPIVGQFIGQAAEGYMAGDSEDFLFSPSTLSIQGQAELVNQVQHALVTVEGTDLTETVSDYYPFQLIGASGDVLEDWDVECDTDTVFTTFPIQATATIPLELRFVSGGGVSADEASYELSADSITIAGSQEAVAAMEAQGAYTLATVELDSVRDGEQISYTIGLADELTNISGVTEVTATISLNKSLVSSTFGATNLSYINLADGWEAEFITQALPVEVRGTAALMDTVTGDSIRLVADFKDFNLAAGRYVIPVTVYLDSAGTSADIGVMDSDYRVVVDLRQTES